MRLTDLNKYKEEIFKVIIFLFIAIAILIVFYLYLPTDLFISYIIGTYGLTAFFLLLMNIFPSHRKKENLSLLDYITATIFIILTPISVVSITLFTLYGNYEVRKKRADENIEQLLKIFKNSEKYVDIDSVRRIIRVSKKELIYSVKKDKEKRFSFNKEQTLIKKNK